MANMTPKQFKRWRKDLGLSQKEAANALGLKRRVVQYYEKGERDGKELQVPLTVRLACFALSQGVTDYRGRDVDDDLSEADATSADASDKAAAADKDAATKVPVVS